MYKQKKTERKRKPPTLDKFEIGQVVKIKEDIVSWPDTQGAEGIIVGQAANNKKFHSVEIEGKGLFHIHEEYLTPISPYNHKFKYELGKMISIFGAKDSGKIVSRSFPPGEYEVLFPVGKIKIRLDEIIS